MKVSEKIMPVVANLMQNDLAYQVDLVCTGKRGQLFFELFFFFYKFGKAGKILLR